ncbi:holo-[acyl-carrier protein] synthase [Haloactinopolyspora alba]|uniref:Holo-[acyl-carrier-protein] synthase n=1 Tax=Haloactinopolyspora alba TaxID=648780 RepID=A0A2P8DYR1_9ACTN|nr:holo-ACP synthase [Haloactinopolyspora alba]PSL02358.1 holo-[acyl-carrier protein] synthase [Haloactinopolyspora alba]
MAIRVGVDVVHISRMRRLLDQQPGLRTELFTSGERRTCGERRNGVGRLAARFAAKEAVLKAFGTGIGPRMRWIDVEIVTGALGRPSVQLYGEVAAVSARRGTQEIDVSLSHTGDVAVANAVVVTSPPDRPGEEEPSCCSS